MKVSVVIPAYNEEHYLGSCLKALQKQQEPADEIIVVDNNSTDKTAAIAKRFKVRLISEKRQGISYARNAGFNAARSDIIARCDADAEATPNWVKRLKTDFTGGMIDAVGGTVDFPDLLGTCLTNLFLDITKLLQKGHETTIGQNMAITKKIWHRVSPYVIMDNTQVHEDLDIALWIWAVGGKVIYDKQLVVKGSSRRTFKNPGSFFLEYPIRAIRTIRMPRNTPGVLSD